MTGNVSFIPPHSPFLETLANYLVARHTPSSLATCTILLPTQRACLKLAEILCDKARHKSTLLPILIPLGSMKEEDLSLSSWKTYGFIENLPPLMEEEERLPRLTQMVQDFYLTRQKPLKTSQACALASHLIHFIDQVQTEGISFQTLKNLVPDDYAAHFQITLEFLNIIGEKWPAHLQKISKIEPAEYGRRLLECRNQYWQDNPSPHPVIAAGSTGSIPATAALLKTIAYLPQGLVILPGLDPTIKEPVLASHPQYTMQKLLEILEVSPSDVSPFLQDSVIPCSRTKILKEIFEKTPTLLPQEQIIEGIQNLSLAECSSTQEEASVIALAIREALEDPEKKISFITPNRELAQRVVSELKRWNIFANDSAGTPFMRTPLGVFFLLTSEWIQSALSNVTLLATLKHPHAHSFKLLAQKIEKNFLRKTIPFDHIILDPDKDPILNPQLKEIQALLKGAQKVASLEKVSFKDVWQCHKNILSLLSKDLSFSFNDTEESKTLREFITKMENASINLSLQKGGDYAALLRNFLTPITVRQKYALHPRLSILGLIEARLIPADCVILGGLNENSWPPKPTSDPWFSQSMRKKFGLPDHEKRVGLSSLDFIHAVSAKNVLLTRALRDQGTPTVPSRLLTRLQSYLKQKDLSIKPNARFLALAQKIHAPEKRSILMPPTPRPPLKTRPRTLSITDITTLMHDPYSLYAKHVLKLKPLKPLDYQPGNLEFGIFIHQVLEHFRKGPLTKEHGITLGHQFFQLYFKECPEKPLWWCRFENILNWFLSVSKNVSARNCWVETKGTLTFLTGQGLFTLVGKADRIEELENGAVIIDYKTGSIPSQKDMEKGLSPQLPLEGLILSRGHFDNIPQQSLQSLAFWKLTGDMEGGAIIEYTKDLNALLETSFEGLKALIDTFDHAETPYLSIPYETELYNDYHHLARVKEWRLNGEKSL